MNNKPVVMSIQSYDYMLDAFLKYDVDVMRPERKLFKDGESYHRMPDLSDRDLILIGGTIDDSSTLELYDMASHASNTARSMKIIVPFYGYATMERAVNSGEIVKAKSRAELLSSIPRAQVKNTFLFLDLHTEGLPYYLHGVNVEHVYAKDAISDIIEEIKQLFLYAADTPARKNPMVLASTDGGRTKWIESLAADFGMDSAFLTKRHTDDGTKVTSINANVRGKGSLLIRRHDTERKLTQQRGRYLHKGGGVGDIRYYYTCTIDHGSGSRRILIISQQDKTTACAGHTSASVEGYRV